MTIRLAALAASVGLAVTACSGAHSMGSMPPLGSRTAGTTSGPSSLGARTTRSLAIAAPAGWSATATGAIAPAAATDLGLLNRAAPVHVVLGLQLRNVDAAKSSIAARRRMSRDAFVSQFGPSQAQVSAAVSYLQAQGFTDVTTAPNNLLVSGTASAATVEKAFNTALHAFSVGGKNYFANTQPAFVPSSLGGNVVAVLGLTNVPGFKAGPLKQPTATTPAAINAQPTPCTQNVNQTTGTAACPRFYDPQTFNITYDAASLAVAKTVQIGIFAVGDPSIAISDFRYNETQFGMPQVPVNVVNAEPPSSDTSGNGEWTLDMTYSQAMAWMPNQIDLYVAASYSFADLSVALNRWASDDVAIVMNASVGGCEAFPYESGDMLVTDMILVEAAAQGQTLFASTGDTGGYCGVDGVPPNGGVGGAPLVEYPASSPYAVAVGGTQLFSNVDGTYLGENAWQSGGGGISQFEYSPYWEQGIQPVGTTAVGYSFRGLPDVAFDAALETGALLYEGGAEYITGGTSLASPLAAGTYARLQFFEVQELGFGAPFFYGLYGSSTPQEISGGPPPTQRIGPFHDILTGTNGLYTAKPNYDYVTGLGSIDVSAMRTVLP